MNYLNQALILKKELDSLRPISTSQEARINQKFRLDWNFHSNNLEGNSLSFGETKMLILHGITASGKPLKDHFEITGHDEAIKLIEEVVKSDRPLTENFIRELHALILKESYEVDAITPEGNARKKLAKVGGYKTHPNHVLTKTGEIFHFAEPFETAAKMSDLISWHTKESTSSDVNPIILAAEFHYKFILIHPFDDGNGRIARILMNFILMRFGFPPVIIKTQDKENYITSLRQADSGLIENFIEYIAKNLAHSLQIMIKGAKGEDIEEQDDLDKKIALLKQEFKEETAPAKIKSKEIILKIYDDLMPKIYDKFITSCKKFDDLYLKSKFQLLVEGNSINTATPIESGRSLIVGHGPFVILYSYTHLNRQGHADFHHQSEINVSFKLESYQLSSATNKAIVKNYNQKITDDEIDLIIKQSTEHHYQKIEQELNKPLNNN